ncbi:flagellar hook-length control protein FliK [Roseiterribacter gracilis]|uniref:flagellar hook-length control protein FliK n=1 Tax=Roseiterribacter gracilis TaxID=2812848 RepID=UPI003B43C56E
MDTVAPIPAAPTRPDLPAPSAAQPADKSSDNARAFERLMQKLGGAKSDRADAANRADAAKSDDKSAPAASARDTTSRPAPRTAQNKTAQASKNDTQPASNTDNDANDAAATDKNGATANNDTSTNDKSPKSDTAAAASTNTAADATTTDTAPAAQLGVLALQAELPVAVAAPVAAPAEPVTAPVVETPTVAPVAAPAAPAPVQQTQVAADAAAQTPVADNAPAASDATQAAPAVEQVAADATAATTAPAATTTPAATVSAATPAVTTVIAAADAKAQDAVTEPEPAPAETQAAPTEATAKPATAKPTAAATKATTTVATEKPTHVAEAEPEAEPAKPLTEHVATHETHEHVVKTEVALTQTAQAEAAPQVDAGRNAPMQIRNLDTTNTTAATDTVLVVAPKNPALAASAIAQVGFHLSRADADGSQAMTINLRPEELGSIEVKLDIKDGVVHAHVVADRSDTLDLLRADPRGLQRALENAGMNTDGGSLSFDLRQNGQGSHNGTQTAGNNAGADGTSDDLDLAVIERPRVVADGRVDVTV